MTLRSHLLRLSMLVVFPVALFGIGATLWNADRERDIFEQGARQRTLALLTAVDTELQGHALRLRVLAESQSLHDGDLAEFRKELAIILPQQPGWRKILIATRDGDLLVGAATQGETPVPTLTAATTLEAGDIGATPRLASVLRVENLADYGGEKLFGVYQPLRVDGEDAMLTALIHPVSILNLLTPQGLPKDWVGVVLDANRTIIARTLDHESMLGKPASDSLQNALDGASDGWFHGTTIEKFEVYTPFNRSTLSGWTVALGIPAKYVESSMYTSLAVFTLGLIGAVSVAMAVAAVYSRRIAAPIVSLASRAKALGAGDEIRPLHHSGFREARVVSQALVNSGEAIREREEKLRAADRAKNEFLAMLGHELRNPLASMAAAAQVLSLKPLDTAAAEFAAGVVTRQVNRMTRLVDDLLNVGRVVSGKVELDLQALDLASVTTQVIDNLRDASLFEGLVVETDLSSAWISGDEARVEQILGNLLQNASKYTPPGGRINIKVCEEKRQAVFEVTDTGIGLHPDLLPRVFDLFTQGSQAMDRQASGLGIGLTLVKKLTEMHGGMISVASSGPDRGAQFKVTFPAIEAPVKEKETPERRVAVTVHKRVLLIEDNDDARQAMSAILNHYGYSVLEAANGPEGIALAIECHPDCAVIDIGLPQVDGYQVAERLRATPCCTGMLLVALSGYGADEARGRAQAAGFDHYLVKPIFPDKLVEVIEGHIA